MPHGVRHTHPRAAILAESAAQIPGSRIFGLTLAFVTSPSHDPSWQRPGSASLVDPEDDLPSANYAGDFETTKIPNLRSRLVERRSERAQRPRATAVCAAAGRPGSVGRARRDRSPTTTGSRSAGRRGTQDLGLLLLRAGFGALLIAHGLQKVFGWWGGSGLGSFGDSLSGLGYQHANILTYVAAGTEIAAGVLLVLGLFTPLAAAAALAYLVNGLLAGIATQDNPRQFAFFLPDGQEFELTLIVVAAAIILVGPGQLRLRRRPRLVASPVHRVFRGAAVGYRRRHRGVGAVERCQSDFRLTALR